MLSLILINVIVNLLLEAKYDRCIKINISKGMFRNLVYETSGFIGNNETLFPNASDQENYSKYIKINLID